MYASPSLNRQSALIHGFSDVNDGNMSYRFGEHDAVLANRSNFLSALGIPLERSASQHGLGDRIHVISESDLGHGMRDFDSSIEASAFITNQKDIGLFLPVADCLPIIIFDPSQNVVALIHASRSSTNLRVTAKVIDKLKAEFNTRPKDLLVAFGPTIRAESYIFDDHIYELVTNDWKPYLKRLGPGRIAVDVPAYNRSQLLEAGLLADKIDDSGIDTGTDLNYFSHVRAAKTQQPEGRIAAAAMLR